MTLTTIYFIRHAEPNYHNHDDFLRELTDKGLQDSKELVNLFSEILIDAVYSSPYKRAVDTITPLALSKQKSIHLENDFRERKITDKWIEDFTGFTEKQWTDFSYRLEGGESLSQVQNRNIQALEKVLQEHKGHTVVIGTHGTALSTIIQYYQPTFGLSDFQRVKHLFPWVVRLQFEDLSFHSFSEINLQP